MEQDVLIITANLNAQLARLLSYERFGAPPKVLRKRRPDDIFIGKATKEQQAIALLWNQVVVTHLRMHKASGQPLGVNPCVDFAHYQQHVMTPILFELLKWSVHRAYPEQWTDLSIRFDKDWNMYALPRKDARPQT